MSSASAQSPFCRSRSTSATRRLCRLARYQAVLTANVVVPTPPRAPTKATRVAELFVDRARLAGMGPAAGQRLAPAAAG